MTGPGRWCRRIGVVVGAVAASWWLVVLVASLVADDPGADGDDLAEGIGVISLAACNVGAFVLASRRPRPGGPLLVATGVAFGLFAVVTAGRNHLLAVAVSGAPFVVSGALMTIADRRRGRAIRDQRS